MSELVKEITDAEFDAAVAEGLTMVDFWASWCGPCKLMIPVLDAVAGKVDFAGIMKVNVEENTQAAAKYGVQSIPTMIIFKNGQKVGQIIGACSEEDLIAELEKHK